MAAEDGVTEAPEAHAAAADAPEMEEDEGERAADGEGLGNGMFDRSVHTDQLEKSRNDVIKKANEQAGMLKALRDYHGPGGRNG